MAKKAKKELTLEEKLQNALVADWEQPYAVPENWVWTRLGEVFQFESGFAFKSSDYQNNGTPLLRISNIQNNSVNFSECVYIEKKVDDRFLVHEGDLLIALSGATTGKSGVYPFADSAYLNQRIGNIKIKIKDSMSPTFRDYFIREQTATILEKAYGGAQPNISPKDLNTFPFPLPPLAEQERIVQRIESLFAKLDTAKELLEEALESFEYRKSALLHQAFTGELTKTWREKHGVSMESWEGKKLNDICDFKSGHPFDSKKFTNTGLQVIRMGNLYNAVLDLTRNPVFFQRTEFDDKIFQKSLIKKGEILLTLTGTKYKRDYGYAILFEGEEELLLNQRIISLTPKSINTKFLLFVLRSDIFRDIFFSNETGGVNQGNVSVTFVKQITIHLPPLPEQEEIVRILDAQLHKEEEAKAHIQHSLEHIEHMKKAILARAFRGELGTNNPKDGHALDLLKGILEQK